MTKVFSQADSCKSMGLMQTAAIMDGQKVWLKNGHGRSGILQIAPLHLPIARAFSQADSCKSSGFRQAAARRIRHQIATENLVDLNCGTRPAANTRGRWRRNECLLKTHWTGIVQVGIGVNATSSKIAVTRGHLQTAATEI